ncbi:TetR/AcrR family transcriptional regulator [Streptomyces sp. NPDC048428]|uniref:TetR/AcrR family transcriptional regulator n=1 Tax=Streptomyces sp. NPDC048428 TaxID=3154503 RepID=UPI003440828B
MATRTRQSPRRRQALTLEQIVRTSVELLDAAGAGALTVRALTERLATGPGAIYWHIGTMDDLLDAATGTVVAAALAARPDEADTGGTGGPAGSPQDEIRGIALGLFDSVTEHPWLAGQLATQLTRKARGPVTLRIFESIGRQVRALGVPRGDWFATTSTLAHYILGATTQSRLDTGDDDAPGSETDRAEFLDTTSRAWLDLDPEDYPFVRAIADQMRQHDDREQFLTGINLVLTGITTLHPPTT